MNQTEPKTYEELVAVAEAYGGTIMDDAEIDAMGEPDEEVAYEDVVL